VIEYAYRWPDGSIAYPDSEGDLGHDSGYAQAIDPAPEVVAAFRAYAASTGRVLVRREVSEFEEAPQPLGDQPVGSFARTPRGAVYVRGDDLDGGGHLGCPWVLVRGGGTKAIATATLERLGAVPISPAEVAAG
jgi:hypothetical protein